MTPRLVRSSSSFSWRAVVVIAAGLGVSAGVQAQPFVCTSVPLVPPTVRGEGLAELLGDIVIDCIGGTPTAPNQVVPQVNIAVTLDTILTSKITSLVNNVYFTEALLFVDEPSSFTHPTVPILNCGNTGAPDSSAAGPGVCSILGGGALGAASTYNGTAGHPNVFQGRSLGLITGQNNQVLFLAIPIDPPGTLCSASVADPSSPCHRTIRITNIRGNAATLGVGPSQVGTISSQIVANPPSGLPIDNPQSVLARVQTGLTASVGVPNGATYTIRVNEGFADAWKPRNISFTVGDNNGIPGNATFQNNRWIYNGGTNTPADDAQNVLGFPYEAESGFQWQNNTTNAPPSTNPPGSVGLPNVGNPLASMGFGGADTGISHSGVADSATRIAVRFNGIPPGASVQVPQQIVLHPWGSCLANPSGVMVLTSTDPAGAGPFTPSFVTSLTSDNNMAVYEFLFADPTCLDSADVPFTVVNAPPGSTVQPVVSYAPFYPSSSALQAAGPGYPIPRFLDASAVYATDVTAQFTISNFSVAYNRGTGAWTQKVTLTNNGAALDSTTAFALDRLNAGWTLVAPDGTTAGTAPPGSPYRIVGAIGSGATVSFTLTFNRAGTPAFGYVPRILSGPRR